MRIVYTREALFNFREILGFLKPKVSRNKLKEIRNKILDKVDQLKENPKMGQKEEYLLHLDQGHRRIAHSHFKIIYLIKEDTIIITDIFDSRQDPQKMNF